MDTVIVIGGGHPDYRHFSLEELKIAGYKIILVDDEEPSAFNPNSFCCVDFDNNAREQARDINQKISNNGQKIFSGVCYIESLLEWASEFFDELNINFIKPSVSKKARSKYLMREAFSESGINVPEYRLYKKTELITGEVDLKYPFIIKPEKGYSSIGVSLIQSLEELKSYLNTINNVNSATYIIEDYISGDEYSIEGFVREKDGYSPLYKTVKFKTALPFFEELGQYADHSIVLSNEDKTVFKQCANSLGIKNSIIHLEVINNGTELTPVELGARLAGDKIPYLHRKLHGSSLVTNFLGTDYSFESIKQNGIGIVFFVPSKEGSLDKDFSFTSSLDNVLDIKFDIRSTKIEIAPKDFFVRLGFAVISASTQTNFVNSANKVIDEFELASGLQLFKLS